VAAAVPGDILRVWDHRSVVYVVTNDDPALADVLLDGANLKERRVLSLEAWQKLPEGTRWYFSTVFLINRERLRSGQRLPDGCAAAPVAEDEVWTQVVRSGRTWGVAHDVTISAPDAAWLRHATQEFRRLSAVPRGPLRRNVRSVAVVPVGGGRATLVAENYVVAANGAAASRRARPGDGRRNGAS
jgi:hypothetical protein